MKKIQREVENKEKALKTAIEKISNAQ